MNATLMPQILPRFHIPPPRATLPLHLDRREREILIGNIDLFAALMSRCYADMPQVTKDCALELAKTLARLKTILQT